MSEGPVSEGLRVTAPGALTLVQDRGFQKARARGVPAAGALDRDGLMLVNGLLGNEPGAAALEIALTAPTLVAEGRAVRIATGRGLAGVVIASDGEERAVGEWTATTLQPGDTLRLSPPERGGIALLGVGGGLDLPEIMGSRSTLIRARLGGFDGRALQAGDLLPVGVCEAEKSGDLGFDVEPPLDKGPLRVVLGPQREWFTEEAVETLLGQPYSVTREADRMGLRLDGPKLTHDPERGADIISDGIAPGAIQVPGAGLPIILSADAQTIGGYPKIATVIRADLSRLASLAPGDSIRFTSASVAEAETAARSRRAELERVIASIGPKRGAGLDEAALREANLVGGVVDMERADHFPGHLYDGA